jgi:hypothetical protein
LLMQKTHPPLGARVTLPGVAPAALLLMSCRG